MDLFPKFYTAILDLKLFYVMSYFFFSTSRTLLINQQSVKIPAKRKDIKRLSSEEEGRKENQYSNTKLI